MRIVHRRSREARQQAFFQKPLASLQDPLTCYTHSSIEYVCLGIISDLFLL